MRVQDSKLMNKLIDLHAKSIKRSLDYVRYGDIKELNRGDILSNYIELLKLKTIDDKNKQEKRDAKNQTISQTSIDKLAKLI